MGERIGAHNMNNMGKKRIQANFIVVLVLILILAACEGKNAGSGPQGSKSSAVSVQTEVEGKQPAEPAEEAEGAAEPAAEPSAEPGSAAAEMFSPLRIAGAGSGGSTPFTSTRCQEKEVSFFFV